MPEEAHFTLDLPRRLPAGRAVPSAQAPLFAAADRRDPAPVALARRISRRTARCGCAGAELNAATVIDAWFIPATAGTIEDAAPQLLSTGARRHDPVAQAGAGIQAERAVSTGVLAVRDRSGQETDVTVQRHARAAPPPAFARRSPQVLGFAFLGGLILNLMPCVFPVLAMKAVGLAAGAAHGADAGARGVLHRRRAAGVRRAGRRAAGGARGRVGGRAGGSSSQSPAFVAAMAWLLFGVGLNLSGRVRDRQPPGRRRAAPGRARRAGGSFFTGAARGAGRHPVHRAVHGRGDRRRAGRPAGR